MEGKGKRKWLHENIDGFMRLYQRKAQRGVEPNDRRYDRKVENEIKRMDPVKLDQLIKGMEGED